MREEARKYGHHRRAFGKPMLGFQVWRHRLADRLTMIEAGEMLTRRAIDLEACGVACNWQISMAKIFAADSCVRVSHECAHIYGGNGFMEEFLIARLNRDALAFSVGAGLGEMMADIVSKTEGLRS